MSLTRLEQFRAEIHNRINELEEEKASIKCGPKETIEHFEMRLESYDDSITELYYELQTFDLLFPHLCPDEDLNGNIHKRKKGEMQVRFLTNPT